MEDLTADGVPDSADLRIRGEGMEYLFRWTVRIWAQGNVVFEHEAVDSLVDGIFGGPGDWVGDGSSGFTGDREEDKALYYFELLPRNMVERAQFGNGHPIFDRTSVAGVYQVVAQELQERGLVNEETVQGIIDRVVERLQAGTPVLLIPNSPLTSRFPLIHIEEIGAFVPLLVW